MRSQKKTVANKKGVKEKGGGQKKGKKTKRASWGVVEWEKDTKSTRGGGLEVTKEGGGKRRRGGTNDQGGKYDNNVFPVPQGIPIGSKRGDWKTGKKLEGGGSRENIKKKAQTKGWGVA